jgi:hypothetical protein
VGYTVILAEDGEEAVSLYRKAFEAETPMGCGDYGFNRTGRNGRSGIDAPLARNRSAGKSRCLQRILQRYGPDYREYGFSGFISKPYTALELGVVLQDLFSV